MKRKLEITELIFKIISYTCLTVFALCCLYPFVYAIVASISGREAVEYGRVVLFPMDIQFDAVAVIQSSPESSHGIFGDALSVKTPVGILPALQFLQSRMTAAAADGQQIHCGQNQQNNNNKNQNRQEQKQQKQEQKRKQQKNEK